MVSVLAFIVVDHGFEARSCQTKDYWIALCCFSTKSAALRAETGWLGIKIICSSGVACQPANCCFSEMTRCFSEMTRFFSEMTQCFSEMTRCFSEMTRCFSEMTRCFSEMTRCFSEMTRCFSEMIRCFSEMTRCFSEMTRCFSEMTRYKNPTNKRVDLV